MCSTATGPMAWAESSRESSNHTRRRVLDELALPAVSTVQACRARRGQLRTSPGSARPRFANSATPSSRRTFQLDLVHEPDQLRMFGLGQRLASRFSLSPGSAPTSSRQALLIR